MSRGIYLIANKKSEPLCLSLVHSIRKAECQLPIRIIEFGGASITDNYLLKEATLVSPNDFPTEAQSFIDEMVKIMSCPKGFLYRFLPFWGDWQEFLYSDNDVLALMNWEELFNYLDSHDLVHADEEYMTQGKYNYHKPEKVIEAFGSDALLSAITAGHFLSRNNINFEEDFKKALNWMKENQDITIPHDQTFLHLSTLLGKWNILNLCRKPHDWASSWVRDYHSPIDIVHILQAKKQRISHLHYSGGEIDFTSPMDNLLLHHLSEKVQRSKLFLYHIKSMFFINKTRKLLKRLKEKTNY